ncbi:unnamed protein product, partial [Musa acuminata var. zebrina]
MLSSAPPDPSGLIMYSDSESLDPTTLSNRALMYVNSPSAASFSERQGRTPAPIDTPLSSCITCRSSSDTCFRLIEYPDFRPLQYTAHTYSSTSFFLCVRVSLSSAILTKPEAISLWRELVSMGSSMRKKGGDLGSSWMARLTLPRRYPKKVTAIALSASNVLLGLPNSATILQPELNMGSSLNILKTPPPPVLDRRPSVACRSSDITPGVSVSDGIRWRARSQRLQVKEDGSQGSSIRC